MEIMANRRHWLWYCLHSEYRHYTCCRPTTWHLVSQKPQPCLAPPGFHRELWIARSEPDRRCPILLGQRPTEPPTRWWEGCRTSGQNMAPMTQTEEAEAQEGGTWLLDPRVRNNAKHHHIFSVKKITDMCILTSKGGQFIIWAITITPLHVAPKKIGTGAPTWMATNWWWVYF